MRPFPKVNKPVHADLVQPTQYTEEKGGGVGAMEWGAYRD